MRARHILIAYEGFWPPDRRHVKRTKREAYDMAVELRIRILQGESFADLAAVHSDCDSRERGGDLGYFLSGDVEPAFEEAVKSVQVGEVAPLTRTQHGWHVVQRLEG